MSAKKTNGLLKSTAVVSSMTMLSRVLGLLRDVVFASFFGAGSTTDAFFVAFKIPNFFRRLVGEGAFAQAFVPVLTETKTKQTHAQVRALIAAASGTLGTVLLLLMLFAMISAEGWVWVFAPGFHQEPVKMQLASELLRLTFPYLPCMAMVALLGSVLNIHQRFWVPAFAPVLLNVVLIAAAVMSAQWFAEPVMALGWGVMVAGVLQLLLHLPFIARLQLLVWPRWHWRHPGVVKIRQLMLPALFGVSVGQINMLLNTILASFLVAGSVSWLYFADRLMELPLGVFGVAIATVILPKLSRDHLAFSPSRFSQTLDWGVQWVWLLGLPAVVALMLLAEPIIATLFYYQAFDLEDVRQSARALSAYSVGVLAFMLVKVLAPAFFARQDTKTPVRIAVMALAVNMGLSLILIRPMAHTGLALATVVAALVNASLLWRAIKQVQVNIADSGADTERVEPLYQSDFPWYRFLAKIAVASSAMGVAVWICLPTRAVWLLEAAWVRSAYLLFWVVLGAGVYAVVLWILRVPQQMMRSGRALTG